MKIAINKAHFPVTVLGPGRRIGLWLQGCSIRCKDCVSKDTWESSSEYEMEIAELVKWCKHTSKEKLDGITISGGEPFDQAKALSTLIDQLRKWQKSANLELDILCYSGYPFHTLQEKHTKLLEKIDAIIPEPYVEALPLTHLWRGSSNQPLIAISPLAKKRYATYQEATIDPQKKQIQIQTDGNHLWCIGIPDRGDMDKMENLAASRGLSFSSVSWR